MTARYAELPELLGQIAGQAAILGIADADVQRLQLVAEELFTNSIAHGYRGECARPVRLSLARRADRPVLRYIDQAPPFDLREHVAESSPEIGGLGIPLIKGMSRTIRYRYLAGQNIVELDL